MYEKFYTNNFDLYKKITDRIIKQIIESQDQNDNEYNDKTPEEWINIVFHFVKWFSQEFINERIIRDIMNYDVYGS